MRVLRSIRCSLSLYHLLQHQQHQQPRLLACLPQAIAQNAVEVGNGFTSIPSNLLGTDWERRRAHFKRAILWAPVGVPPERAVKSAPASSSCRNLSIPWKAFSSVLKGSPLPASGGGNLCSGGSQDPCGPRRRTKSSADSCKRTEESGGLPVISLDQLKV